MLDISVHFQLAKNSINAISFFSSDSTKGTNDLLLSNIHALFASFSWVVFSYLFISSNYSIGASEIY